VFGVQKNIKKVLILTQYLSGGLAPESQGNSVTFQPERGGLRAGSTWKVEKNGKPKIFEL